MITYTLEPIASIWDECLACCQAHWLETSMYAEGQVLDLRLERYEEHEKARVFVTIVARDNGIFAGFCWMYLTPSMHTQELLATEDVLYLKPEYRRGRNGYRLYQFVIDEMRRLGAKHIMVTAPPGSASDRILATMGGTLAAHAYTKAL